MSKKLLIVESPGKIKTLEKILGNEYIVKASYGHIRQLDKKSLGIDTENNYAQSYQIIPIRKKLINELKELKKKCSEVILASDADLEGEAIAWHIAEVLNLNIDTNPRIVFQEITKPSIKKALDNPTQINMSMVNAQLARSVLDKLIGYTLSPLLWKQIKNSLSAGRVQSMACRLVVDRENEINNFSRNNYFKVTSLFENKENKIKINSVLDRQLKASEDIEEYIRLLDESDFIVKSITKSKSKRNAPAPFITSSLQQEANRRFNMSSKQTMAVAQSLYEGGHITYHRTDSVNLSATILPDIKEYIIDNFGEEYVNIKTYKNKTKNAQEAHEAIRPTKIKKVDKLNDNDKKIYEIILNRTLASQMSAIDIENLTAKISISKNKDNFVSKCQKVLFDGYSKLYQTKDEDDNDEKDDENPVKIFEKIKKGIEFNYKNIKAIETFTKPTPRYNEASLIKKLEDLGIGRPSTYASIISTVLDREYVVKETREGTKKNRNIYILEDSKITNKSEEITTEKEKNKLFPTEIGTIVNDFLFDKFKDTLNYDLTAKIEGQLDKISKGSTNWISVVDGFYKPVVNDIKSICDLEVRDCPKEKEKYSRILGNHPKTGEKIQVRIGRYGPLIQLGSIDDDNDDFELNQEIKYVAIPKGIDMKNLKIEDAIKLLEFPKYLGKINGNSVSVMNGKFGYYLKYNNKNYTLSKDDDPNTFTLKEAENIINEKDNSIVKEITDTIKIIKGPYGIYLKHGKKNVSLPKDIDPKEIDKEKADELASKKKIFFRKKF